MKNETFKELLWQRGEELYREMPWRKDTRPYYVLVSELMLQQTQVSRVIPKFEQFIIAFPDEQSLANASLADVLKLWQGLGYNRRAKFLHESAKHITALGRFPNTQDELVLLPGVGKNTAGAILAYSFNLPAIFIETNIRTVYIHHFYNDQFEVDDKELIEQLTLTIDNDNPRQFYWALMDYGSWLKSQGVKNVLASRHYKKQSALKGSIRETRGAIIRALTSKSYTLVELKSEVGMEERFQMALMGIMTDGLVEQTGKYLHLTK